MSGAPPVLSTKILTEDDIILDSVVLSGADPTYDWGADSRVSPNPPYNVYAPTAVTGGLINKTFSLISAQPSLPFNSNGGSKFGDFRWRMTTDATIAPNQQFDGWFNFARTPSLPLTARIHRIHFEVVVDANNYVRLGPQDPRFFGTQYRGAWAVGLQARFTPPEWSSVPGHVGVVFGKVGSTVSWGFYYDSSRVFTTPITPPPGYVTQDIVTGRLNRTTWDFSGNTGPDGSWHVLASTPLSYSEFFDWFQHLRIEYICTNYGGFGFSGGMGYVQACDEFQTIDVNTTVAFSGFRIIIEYEFASGGSVDIDGSFDAGAQFSQIDGEEVGEGFAVGASAISGDIRIVTTPPVVDIPPPDLPVVEPFPPEPPPPAPGPPPVFGFGAGGSGAADCRCEAIFRRLGDPSRRIWTDVEIDGLLEQASREMCTQTRLIWDWTYLEAQVAVENVPWYLTEIERVTWDRRTIDADIHRNHRYGNSRYELETGEVYSYTWRKDGPRAVRKIRVPASPVERYDVIGSWGVPRGLSDLDFVGTDDWDGFGVPRQTPGEHPIGLRSTYAVRGIPRRFHRDGRNVRLEHWRLTAGNGCCSAEIPDRYRKYLDWYVMWKALSRQSPGQDLKLATWYQQRWVDGLARIKRRIGRQQAERTGRLGGPSPTYPGGSPPRPKLPWNYGSRVR